MNKKKTPSAKTVDLLRPLWQDATAAIRVNVVLRAEELGLFTILHTPQSTAAIAKFSGLSLRQSMFFLTLLCAMGLLVTKDQEIYQLAEDFRPLFDADNDGYFTDALIFRMRSLQSYATTILDMGTTLLQRPLPSPMPLSWQEAGRMHLSQDQKVLIAPFAITCVKSFQTLLPTQKSTFLDLGGSPGNVALALAEHYPDFSGMVFDLPETREVISDNIIRHRMQHRILVQTGIFPEDDIGSARYDLIWCAQLFYFIDDVALGLSKIYQALNPGGLLFFAHAEVPQDMTLNRMILPWYMNIYLKNMNIFPENTWQEKLCACGFDVLSAHYAEYFPVAPLKMLVARKKS